MKPEIPLQKLKRASAPVSDRFSIDRWKSVAGVYDASRPHRHNYFEVLVFFRGGGFHEIDFNRYPLKDHSLHFVAAHSVHLLRRAKRSQGATILFSGDLYAGDDAQKRFFHNLDLYSGKHGHVLNLSGNEFEPFHHLLLQMELEYARAEGTSEIILKSLLTLFLAQAERQFSINNPGTEKKTITNPIIEKYRNLVETDFLNHRTMREYADMLHVSPKHLNELCKQHLSLTAQKVLHNRLLLEIKRMLVHSDKQVKEICYDTGFTDPAHFNHFFRFYMGMTPLEYRKESR